mmetsp:Transcript_34929/g.100596  ORF Transcript_34929/g.100596 Transcript_34929/m.100596 type:complete len:261 (-) Transcript_34929:130-912(-)
MPRLLVQDLNIFKFWVYTQSEIRRKSPRCGRPSNERDVFLSHDREAHHNSRVVNILVVQTSLEVRKRSSTSSRVRHDLETLVNQIFLKKLRKHPPNTLHERGIHRLVVIFKVNPPPQSSDGRFPLFGVASDDSSARLVVFVDTHGKNLITMGDVELLINLILHGKTVAIPSSSAIHMLSCHCSISSHSILDGASKNVPIVRKTSGERRTIVEGVLFVPSFQTQLILTTKRIFLLPLLDDLFLSLGKVQCWWQRRHFVFYA